MGVRAREGPRPRVGRRPAPVGLVGRMLWVSALLLLVCAIARFSASSVAVGNETALSTAEMQTQAAMPAMCKVRKGGACNARRQCASTARTLSESYLCPLD